MKRILIYGMSNKLGGVEMIIKSIIQRLNKDLFCVDIILPLGECLYENQLDSFCVYRLPLWGNKPIRFRNELKKLFLCHPPPGEQTGPCRCSRRKGWRSRTGQGAGGQGSYPQQRE